VTIPATATDQEVTDFFNGADGDKDGFLTKEEIKAFYLANSQAIADADLDSAFSKSDTDADGKLTSAELRAYIPAPPAEPVAPTDPATPTDPAKPTDPVTPTEPAAPAENKTEPVTPTEPATPAENKTEPVTPVENKTEPVTPIKPEIPSGDQTTPVPPTEHEIKHNSSAKIFNKEVEEFFDKWDTNNDKTLSKEEVKAALQSVWPGTSDAEVDAIFSKLDSNEDGSLSDDEIKMKETKKEEPPVETPLWLWAVVVAGYVVVGLYVLWDKKCSKHAHEEEGKHDHNHHGDGFHKADNESQKPLNPTLQ